MQKVNDVQVIAGQPFYVTKNLFVACLVNAAMGVLYVWSLFILPLETKLGVDRSILSVAPALALVAFTCGMALQDFLMRGLFFLRYFALMTFLVAGGGHIVFCLFPSVWALFVGYGICFGFGAGSGYGLALTLATRTPSRVRTMSIGITVAAFAAGGIVLPGLFARVITATDPQVSFAVIGGSLVALGLVVAGLLQNSSTDWPDDGMLQLPPRAEQSLLSTTFFRLALGFFFICYAGLLVISHVAAMLAHKKVSTSVVALGPVLFTFGYLIGSLLGGKLVEAIGGRPVLILANALSSVGLGVLVFSTGNLALGGIVIVGAVFGSSASFMPTIIGEQYGSDQISRVYGKLMMSYGAAGLLAPWLTGIIYVRTGDYSAACAVGITMCVTGMILGITMPTKDRLTLLS
jgi:MFS transporter, OFA family, oxalate/formate antiporter